MTNSIAPDLSPHASRPHLTLVANLIPLAGVWWWGWDVFQVLVLYWMQTVMVVIWTLLHLHKLPGEKLGDITVNGVERPATHQDLLLLIGGVGFVFCAAHAPFLWVLFSGEWSLRVHGPVTFWQHMVIASGAWAPLLINVIAGAVSYIETPPWSAFMCWIGQRIGLAETSHADGDVGSVITPMLGRVVLMQVAIIFGAMLAQVVGSTAPLLILIGLKTLADLSGHVPASAVTMTTGAKKIVLGG
jgi:Family of unknown function (DUF6498)